MAHDEAQLCLDVEERLAWGILIFRGLCDLEARTQAHALGKQSSDANQFLEVIPVFYQLWLSASESYLEMGRECIRKGFAVAGVGEFQETMDEARCLLGNLELEDEIRPIGELIEHARPENPHPGRYGA